MDQTPPSEGSPQAPLRPEIVAEHRYYPPPQKSHWLGRLFMAFLLLGLFGSIFLNLLLFVVLGMSSLGSIENPGRAHEEFVSGNRSGDDKVAIISIEGTILSGEGFFKLQIDQARRDAAKGNLKAIVVRVNSPGGTITGSDYMLHHLRELSEKSNIPMVVSMGGLAASGGYYVSMCVGDTPEAIYAEPTTWTGSIGVLIPSYNVAELMDRWGIRDTTVASGPLKTMGSFAHPMTPEEKIIFKGLVNDGFSQFKSVIMQGRPKFRQDPEALDRVATGQIFTANQALESGLVDKIGFIEDAVDRAVSLAGLSKGNVKVVKYKAIPNLSQILFGKSQAKQSIDLTAILDTTTPRAYFLCTRLPAFVRNGD